MNLKTSSKSLELDLSPSTFQLKRELFMQPYS